MKNIQDKIEQAIYGYDPQEFLPIFYDGKLGNRNAFIMYKLRTVARKLPVVQ